MERLIVVIAVTVPVASRPQLNAVPYGYPLDEAREAVERLCGVPSHVWRFGIPRGKVDGSGWLLVVERVRVVERRLACPEILFLLLASAMAFDEREVADLDRLLEYETQGRMQCLEHGGGSRPESRHRHACPYRCCELGPELSSRFRW